MVYYLQWMLELIKVLDILIYTMGCHMISWQPAQISIMHSIKKYCTDITMPNPSQLKSVWFQRGSKTI